MSEGWVVSASEAKKNAAHARRLGVMEAVKQTSERGDGNVDVFDLTVEDREWVQKLGYMVVALNVPSCFNISWA